MHIPAAGKALHVKQSCWSMTSSPSSPAVPNSAEPDKQNLTALFEGTYLGSSSSLAGVARSKAILHGNCLKQQQPVTRRDTSVGVTSVLSLKSP